MVGRRSASIAKGTAYTQDGKVFSTQPHGKLRRVCQWTGLLRFNYRQSSFAAMIDHRRDDVGKQSLENCHIFP